MVSGFLKKYVRSSRSLMVGVSLAFVMGTMQSAKGQSTVPVSAPGRLPTLLTTLPLLPGLAPVPTQAEDASTVRLVVKLSQRRVYLYRGDRVLATYPIAIGKHGWETPIGNFKVLSKEKNPVFKSFRTGELIYPGPDNPLGVRWIGIWTDGKTQIGFHGTNQEELLGQAVSHGCIRMRNRDVTAMFEQIGIGTAVVVEP